MRILAELDANLCAEDAYGKQPCHYASEQGHDSTVERLVKLGADPEDQTHNGRSCAALAAQHGRASTVKLLHDLGADIDEVGSMFGGRRPLHFACATGDAETVRMLLRLGADADGTDNMQNGPAHCAALEGRRDIVQLLGEYDCDLDAVNDDGLTPAQLLAQFATGATDGAWLIQVGGMGADGHGGAGAKARRNRRRLSTRGRRMGPADSRRSQRPSHLCLWHMPGTPRMRADHQDRHLNPSGAACRRRGPRSTTSARRRRCRRKPSNPTTSTRASSASMSLLYAAMASMSRGGSATVRFGAGDELASGVPSRSSCSPSVRGGAQRRKQPAPPRRRRGGCLIGRNAVLGRFQGGELALAAALGGRLHAAGHGARVLLLRRHVVFWAAGQPCGACGLPFARRAKSQQATTGDRSRPKTGRLTPISTRPRALRAPIVSS